MSRPLCAVLLAAGEGMRLRPLTGIRPKALCPVGNVALLDRALAAVASLGFTGADQVAINAWHLPEEIVAHPAHAFVSVETGPKPLGSSGGLAALRGWIDGRDVVVANADAYLAGGSLSGLTRGWTGSGVRLLAVPALGHGAEFGSARFAGFCVIPWRRIEALAIAPTDLVRTVWRPAEAAGELTLVPYGGDYIDCGTPADYLAANLHAAAASGGSIVAADAVRSGRVTASVIGAGARVDGTVTRSVVWPDAVVERDEILTDAIRYGQRPSDTIQVSD